MVVVVIVCLLICMFPCKTWMNVLCTCFLIYIDTLVIDLILFVIFFIGQKSFAFFSISPCVSLGTFNLVWAEENKLDKALAFNSKKFRIKSHYFL